MVHGIQVKFTTIGLAEVKNHVIFISTGKRTVFSQELG